MIGIEKYYNNIDNTCLKKLYLFKGTMHYPFIQYSAKVSIKLVTVINLKQNDKPVQNQIIM